MIKTIKMKKIYKRSCLDQFVVDYALDRGCKLSGE